MIRIDIKFIVILFVFGIFPGLFGCTSMNVKDAESRTSFGEKLMEEGKFEEAIDVFQELADTKMEQKRFNQIALLNMGKCYMEFNDYFNAYSAFSRLEDEYPSTVYMKELEDYQVICANNIINALSDDIKDGHYQIFEDNDNVIKIMRKIASKFVNDDFTDDIYFNLGNYFFSKERYNDAILEYETVVKLYPDSEWVGNAYFDLAVTYKALYKGIDYDDEMLGEARKNMTRFLSYNSEDTEMKQKADDFIKELDEIDAVRLHKHALFYKREENMKAYDLIIKEILAKYPYTKIAKSIKSGK